MNGFKSFEVRDLLALVVTLGGFYLLHSGDTELRLLVGSLLTIVLSFYFGTSQSSKLKDETIAKLRSPNNGN